LPTVINPVITGYITSLIGLVWCGVFILGFLIGRAEGKGQSEQRREDRERPSSYSITPIYPTFQDGAGDDEEQAESGQDQD